MFGSFARFTGIDSAAAGSLLQESAIRATLSGNSVVVWQFLELIGVKSDNQKKAPTLKALAIVAAEYGQAKDLRSITMKAEKSPKKVIAVQFFAKAAIMGLQGDRTLIDSYQTDVEAAQKADAEARKAAREAKKAAAPAPTTGAVPMGQTDATGIVVPATTVVETVAEEGADNEVTNDAPETPAVAPAIDAIPVATREHDPIDAALSMLEAALQSGLLGQSSMGRICAMADAIDAKARADQAIEEAQRDADNASAGLIPAET